jgi:hypothetical protein
MSLSDEDMKKLVRIGELTNLIRAEIDRLDKGSEATAETVIANLTAGGVVRNIHVGGKNLGKLETLEWYGGQIVDVLENKSWFAVNSLINCVDKFAPAL